MLVNKTCNSGLERWVIIENSTNRKFWEEIIIPAFL
jgi:hypothetical protein